MSTRRAWIDDSNETRLSGFIEPDPGGGIPSGSGSPIGAVTPAAIGELYIDSDTGALYIAQDTTDTAWAQVGGASDDEAAGASVVGMASARLMGVGGGGAIITDEDANQGSGNGVYWNVNGSDELQTLEVVTGDGSLTTRIADPAGTFTSGPGGIIFPTSDPGVAGAWWDDAGTLTKSTG